MPGPQPLLCALLLFAILAASLVHADCAAAGIDPAPTNLNTKANT
jgi:hypothetical protein